MKAARLASVIAACAFSGCVLPIPTSRVAAPGVQGRVLNAQTGAPIDLAAIVVDEFKEASVMSARDGSFRTDRITRSRPYWVWWPFGGDPVKTVKLRVVRPGFAKHKEKIEWHPNTQPDVVLAQPITLKTKSAGDAARDVLDR